MSPPVIQLTNVSKIFQGDFWKPKVKVLHEVSLSIESGDVFGLIGPNGAGKTTTIKILLGLVQATSGEVLVQGKPSSRTDIRKLIGYLPENAYYYDFLRTEEVLHFYGRLFGLERRARERRVDELLELVGLRDRKGVLLRHYSKGMLQRIGIAQALMNDPSIVILDEPMSGLDPIGRREVRDIILRLADRKKTILFSSHILTDVEAICEKAGILVKGTLRASGPISKLVNARVKSIEIVFEGECSSPPEAWQNWANLRQSGGETLCSLSHPERLDEVLSWGKARGLTLLSVTPNKESLEDLLVEQVGGAT